MRKVEVQFERGGSFVIELLEDEAPKTCEGILKALPVHNSEARHARFGGQEFYTHLRVGEAGPENQVKRARGDVAFNPDPDWCALIIYYGDSLAEPRPGGHYFNKVGRITSGLEELEAVGERIWLKGAENLSLRLLSEA